MAEDLIRAMIIIQKSTGIALTSTKWYNLLKWFIKSSVSNKVLSKPSWAKSPTLLFSTTLSLHTCFKACDSFSGWKNQCFTITDYMLPKSVNLILNAGRSNSSVLKRTVLSSAAVLVLVTWVIKGFPITSWKNHLTHKFWKIC